MTIYKKLSARPRKLLENRVWRTYTGGKLIEAWQRKDNPCHSEFPEEWMASTVQARNTGREHIIEGLSSVQLENGRQITLKELIQSAPDRFLGKKHVKKYGCETGLLSKVLNSRERLTIQVHPDKKFALEAFNSCFGKTESWYILGGEVIENEEPYVLLGFKPGITREKWRDIFEKQDVGAMLNALHKIRVKKGEVYLLEAGVPHAIGSGCFLIEVQEPTDFTFRTERTTPTGNVVPDSLCHQGIGFEKMLDSFHYNGYSLEETLYRWKLKPHTARQIGPNKEMALVREEHTSCFGVRELSVQTALPFSYDVFFVAAIISGNGRLKWDGGEMGVTQSDQIFIPAGVDSVCWKNSSAEKLRVVLCFPPKS